MEIVLISDGSLPMESPLRKLPFFFATRLVAMDKVSPSTVGCAKVAIIELSGSTDAGLTALKASWDCIAAIPVICIAAPKNRREMIQAGALGRTERMDREVPFSLLLKQVKDLIDGDVLKALPKCCPECTKVAYMKGSTFLDSLCFSAVEGTRICTELMNESAEEMLTALKTDGLSCWLSTVATHHSGTYCHSLQVAGLAGMLAKHLGWGDADCKELIAGGLVHDIGKTRIPLTILDKAGKLTQQERDLVDKHPAFGQEILKTRPEISADIKRMAVQHHEMLDGSGYPRGLSGDQLVPKVRLMTICDIYVALTEERSYKKSFPARTAVAMLKEMGPKLDQAMVEKLDEMLFGRDFGAVTRAAPAA